MTLPEARSGGKITMSRIARTLIALLLLLAFCGPVAAQSSPRGSQPAGLLAGSVSWLWKRFYNPLSQLLKGRGAIDPNGNPIPGTDSRSACDPNGAQCTDGRGAIDPNG